jgi:hypothetical protein
MKKQQYFYTSLDKPKWYLNMENYNQLSREDFMHFFRDTEKLDELTPDDRIEIFRTILLGSSDFSIELINEILVDYAVDHLEVLEISNGKK